jgi:hypothetical protein
MKGEVAALFLYTLKHHLLAKEMNLSGISHELHDSCYVTLPGELGNCGFIGVQELIQCYDGNELLICLF